MTTFEVLTLMIAFAMLVVHIINTKKITSPPRKGKLVIIMILKYSKP